MDYSFSDVEQWSDSKNLILAKVCCMVILGISSTVAGIMPMLLVFMIQKNDLRTISFNVVDKVLSFALLFGGGVLLFTVFLHLLPEVRESVDELLENKLMPKIPLPWPELLMCLGFLAMFIIEELLHQLLSRKQPLKSGIDNPVFIEVSVEENRSIKSTTKNYNTCNGRVISQHVECGLHVVERISRPSVRNFLIVMALSIHELFEGMAVGLEKYIPLVWYLLTAVACHKVVLAVCVGIQLAASGGKHFLNYAYVIMFALTSPVGIAVGTIMTSNAGKSALVTQLSVVLQGIATGTLLYIVFFEVLKERSDTYSVRGIKKLSAVMLGFIFMTTLHLCLNYE